MSRSLPGLFDAVPDALVVVDGAGRIVRANRQAEALFGYPAGGLDGVEVEALVPASSRERHRRHRADYMAVPRVRPMGAGGMTLVGQRRSGEQFPVEIALSPLPDAQAPLFLASIRDVSETQRVRQALARARYDAVVARIGRLALEARDEESTLPAIPALLVEALDLDGVLLAFETDGREPEAYSAGDYRPGPAGTAGWPAVWAGLASTWMLGEGAAPPGLDSPPPGRSALVPLADRQRGIGLLAAFAPAGRDFGHDVLHALQSTATLVAAFLQRRRSEAQLAHAQRLDALGQLTGGVAHDFNNLLTVLSGNLQLLRIEAGHDAALAPLIDSALESADHGAQLTAKLLSFARRQQLRPRTVDVAGFLESFRGLLERTLGPAVDVAVGVHAPALRLHVDPAQLEAALLNLALNARDAMPAGGRLAIDADLQWLGAPDDPDGIAPGRYVVLRVADTGAGMAPETLRRAVEPFFTTKHGGRGSGLGLSMVYGFARQSGGGLRIQSRPAHGTTVSLCLAARELPPDAQPAITPRVRAGAGEPVLVVDDDPAVRDTTARLLRSLGYRADTAADAAQALHLLDASAPRLLLTDVMLGPGPDGIALAVQARRRWPALAVLLTTGDPFQPRGRAARFPLLPKPFGREALADAVAAALAGAGAHGPARGRARRSAQPDG